MIILQKNWKYLKKNDFTIRDEIWELTLGWKTKIFSNWFEKKLENRNKLSIFGFFKFQKMKFTQHFIRAVISIRIYSDIWVSVWQKKKKRKKIRKNQFWPPSLQGRFSQISWHIKNYIHNIFLKYLLVMFQNWVCY